MPNEVLVVLNLKGDAFSFYTVHALDILNSIIFQ